MPAARRVATTIAAKLEVIDSNVREMKHQRQLADERHTETQEAVAVLDGLDADNVFVRDEDRWKLRAALSKILDR